MKERHGRGYRRRPYFALVRVLSASTIFLAWPPQRVQSWGDMRILRTPRFRMTRAFGPCKATGVSALNFALVANLRRRLNMWCCRIMFVLRSRRDQMFIAPGTKETIQLRRSGTFPLPGYCAPPQLQKSFRLPASINISSLRNDESFTATHNYPTTT
jgi:hypothetical protein